MEKEKEEEKEKNDNGDAPANGTVSWRRELASWPFVLAALTMQVSLQPPPSFCSAALHTALCLGCEMAQMLVSKSVDRWCLKSSLVANPLGGNKDSTDPTFFIVPGEVSRLWDLICLEMFFQPS